MNTIDAATYAAQFAQLEIQPFLDRNDTRESTLKAEVTGLESLEDAVKDFMSTVSSLSSSTNPIATNSATVSNDDYFSVSADADAIAGSYPIFVSQLASSHIISSAFTPNGLDSAGNSISLDSELPSFGIININLTDENGDQRLDDEGNPIAPLSVDLSTDLAAGATLGDLIDHINQHSDNPSVQLSLVRSDGQLHLLSSSQVSGRNAVIDISFTEDATDPSPGDNDWLQTAFDATPSVVAQAQDAKFFIGAENTGVEITGSTNSFSNVIDGVDVELKSAQQSGDSPSTLDISFDSSTTKSNVEKLLNAYNTLMDNLDYLTRPGSEEEDPGSLARDGSVKSLKRSIAAYFRGEYGTGGNTLFAVGIEIDKNGDAQIDSDRFDEAIEADRFTFDDMFKGDDGLLEQLDNFISPFSDSGGMIDSKQERIDGQIRSIEESNDRLNLRYEMQYERYLKQFSELNTLIDQMNQTSSLFLI